MTIEKELEMEYYLCNAFSRPKRTDFFEGIRAAIIDKDKSPKWKHKSVEEVKKEEVEELFKKREGPLFGLDRAVPKL